MPIITAPAELAFDIFSPTSRGLMENISRRVDNFMRVTGGSELAKSAMENFKSVTSGTIFRKIQAIKNRYQRVLKLPDRLQRATTLGELQTANTITIPYILACPTVNSYLRDDMIDGYKKHYTDPYVDKDKMANPYYRNVISNIFLEEDDKMIARCIVNDKLDPLTLVEKTSVLSMWKLAESYLEEGYDPTSEDNEMVK